MPPPCGLPCVVTVSSVLQWESTFPTGVSSRTFHNRAVPSSQAVATRSPLGLKTANLTGAGCRTGGSTLCAIAKSHNPQNRSWAQRLDSQMFFNRLFSDGWLVRQGIVPFHEILFDLLAPTPVDLAWRIFALPQPHVTKLVL